MDFEKPSHRVRRSGRPGPSTLVPGGVPTTVTTDETDREAAGPDPLSLYLAEIGRRPLLRAEDEQRLGRAIDAGRRAREELGRTPTPERREALDALVAEGERAETTFVEANLRLVVSIARRYVRSGVPLLDLIQEGNIGLLRAVERFDHRRGLRFSTYATWVIRQAVGRAVANTGRLIRLPVHTGETAARARAAANRLEAELGRVPTTAEVAAATGLSPEKAGEALRNAELPLSLSSPFGEDGEGELGDVIADGHSTFGAVAASLLPYEVGRLLDKLSDRERCIIELRYGLGGAEPQSFLTVARQLGLGAEPTRTLHHRAIRKLRVLGDHGDVRELMRTTG